MEHFESYSHAVAALGGFSILVIVLSMVSVAGASSDNRTESGHFKRNYEDVGYRKSRAFMNAIEAAGPFIGATLAAILIGASPFWVNLFASVFLLGRIAVAFVHIGTTNQPLRSVCWLVSTLCVLALAVMSIWGALT